jgi:hypothetical protein
LTATRDGATNGPLTRNQDKKPGKVEPVKAIASILMSMLVAAACGGSDKGETTTPASDEMAPPAGDQGQATEQPPAETPPPAEQPPPPPAPKMFSATVAVAPSKGSKLKATTVTLSQEEGKPASVSGSVEGLKAGKYVWQIHEGDCKKVGKAFAATESATVAVEITKEAPTAQLSGEQPWMLDGEQSVVGKALVLHEMKKDKPGKALGCGVISTGEAAPPAEGSAPAGGGGGGGGGM